MNDPIALLKQDHRDVAAMLKILDASRPGARRRSTVDKVTAALRVHMQFEEAELYPLVAEKIGREEAKEATIEHDLARTGVAQLNELVDEPGFGAVVAMVTAGIRHHVKEEETELFPKLKKQLDRDTLSALGDDYVAMKKQAAKKTTGSNAAGRGMILRVPRRPTRTTMLLVALVMLLIGAAVAGAVVVRARDTD